MAMLLLALAAALPGTVLAQASGDVATRLDRLERALGNKGLLDLARQVELLQQEVRQLRGELETQIHALEQVRKSQRQAYLDAERRIGVLESGGAASAGGLLQPVEPPLPTLQEPTGLSVAGTPSEQAMNVDVQSGLPGAGRFQTPAGAPGPVPGSGRFESAAGAPGPVAGSGRFESAAGAPAPLPGSGRFESAAGAPAPLPGSGRFESAADAPGPIPGARIGADNPALVMADPAAQVQRGVSQAPGQRPLPPASQQGTLAPSILPSGPAVDSSESEAAYREAFGMLKAGQYDHSIAAFNEFLQKYPSSQYADNAQYWLGEAYYVMRQFDPAIEQYQKLVAGYPDSKKQSHAMLKIAYSYHELGLGDQAIAVLADLKNRFPGSAAARLADERLQRIRSEGP